MVPSSLSLESAYRAAVPIVWAPADDRDGMVGRTVTAVRVHA